MRSSSRCDHSRECSGRHCARHLVARAEGIKGQRALWRLVQNDRLVVADLSRTAVGLMGRDPPYLPPLRSGSLPVADSQQPPRMPRLVVAPFRRAGRSRRSRPPTRGDACRRTARIAGLSRPDREGQMVTHLSMAPP
jgi:hypothetical protein